MTNPAATNVEDIPRTRLRLDRALDSLAVTFRGATARADEAQCVCHWGDPEELALLKVPDVELDPDLLYRTWHAYDWDDHGAVLRRVLPQFARALTGGHVEPYLMEEVGRSFGMGKWNRWPVRQSAVVWEFLHAWWAHSLTDPDPVAPVYELLAVCAEASGVLSPWLTVWESLDHPVADRHLATAAAQWEYELLGDELPWKNWWREDDDADEMRTELTTWLVRHVPARLRSQDAATVELLHRVRLMGLTGPARWEDPHWPDRRY
ncbi:hypothetical protein [Streptomyces sp. AK08-02]|uniref:hypothetical protein n=1 Tax=Streptomyces sp. AK08-02 TaxID=3028654 RepID=UPI0029AFE5EA|nr:hypothetical protein [Streptomyces sp. AK08-02]MDX3747956.1 hypothetical protein [Streptomyces sp. AK08-02]